MLNPFTPGGTNKFRVTGSTSALLLSTASSVQSQQVRVASPAGSPLAFLKFGGSSVTATIADMPILPGTCSVFTVPGADTYVAGIAASSSATLYMTIGAGA